MTETCVRLKCCKITKTRLEDHGKFLVSYEKKNQESYLEILWVLIKLVQDLSKKFFKILLTSCKALAKIRSKKYCKIL